MRFSIFILILFLSNGSAAQNLSKKYFFGSNDFHKTNKELVLIVKAPHTDFAKNLGSRYYNDTLFLQKISSEFFTEVDTSDHTISANMCGYDLFFYVKKNNNLKLIRAINSNCNLDDIGLTNANGKCENLELLKTSGIPLKIDTLQSNVTYGNKDSISRGLLFFRDLAIYSESEFTEYEYWIGDNNSQNLPKWYYDYIARTTIKLDTLQSIHDNVLSYLAAKGIDSIAYRAINWQIDSKDLKEIHQCAFKKKIYPSSIDITFYFSKDETSFFKDLNSSSILPEAFTDFDNSHRYTFLFKKPQTAILDENSR